MTNNMIPIEYVILFAMAIVEVVRKRIPDTWSDLKPFVAFVIAIGCNVANAALFGGDALSAGKDAFIAAGVALAMFGGGNAIGKIIAPKQTATTTVTTITTIPAAVETPAISTEAPAVSGDQSQNG